MRVYHHKVGIDSADRQEVANRLLSHGIHEENVFYNRLNFFLVVESLLLGALVTTYGSDTPPPTKILSAFPIVGFLTSTLWFVVQREKLIMLKVLVYRLRREVPDFDWTYRMTRRHRWGSIKSTDSLALAIPTLFVVAWAWIGCVLILNW